MVKTSTTLTTFADLCGDAVAGKSGRIARPLDRLLSQLLSDDFALRVNISTASAMRRLIRQTPEYDELVAALKDGRLDEQAVEQFANQQLRTLRPKLLIRGDSALAALAVALEMHPPRICRTIFATNERIQAGGTRNGLTRCTAVPATSHRTYGKVQRSSF